MHGYRKAVLKPGILDRANLPTEVRRVRAMWVPRDLKKKLIFERLDGSRYEWRTPHNAEQTWIGIDAGRNAFWMWDTEPSVWWGDEPLW